MGKDAKMLENCGQFGGLDRFECREALWQELESLGDSIKVEKHMQRVPRSQRGGEIIEPMVSSQWFMKMQDMADRALEVVKNKELVFYPERFEKV